LAGVGVGDFIVAVGDVDVKWSRHDQVVAMIRDSGLAVRLSLVTPVDRNFIDPADPLSYSRDAHDVTSVDREATAPRSTLEEDRASQLAASHGGASHGAGQQPTTQVDTPTLSRYWGFRRKRNKNS